MTARSRLLLDLGLFAGVFIAYNPAWTGLAVHEWLSVAAIVPLLFHVIINWDQVTHWLRRFAARLRAASRVNLVVDAALFVAFVTVMLSGLLISQEVAGFFGITIAPSSLWLETHSVSGDAAVALLLVHFALHWRWIAGVARRLAAAPAARQRPRAYTEGGT